jgi:class 3 adenylate cyclase
MLATDIAGYSSPRRDDETRLHLREAHYKVLGDALSGSGIAWDECLHEDEGDGALVVLPPDMAPAGLIDPFPVRLGQLLRRHNRMSSEAARLQLRVTIHRGPVFADAHGVAGQDSTYLFRMLDAKPLRDRLGGAQASELALAVSDHVHETMVLRHPSLADPSQFTAFRSPVKRTPITGWLYTPGRDA